MFHLLIFGMIYFIIKSDINIYENEPYENKKRKYKTKPS